MTDQPTPFYPTPKQPRLLWNGRDKRKAVEPLPVQTVEIIRPFYADKAQGALDMAHEIAPENRLIWTNDNLVALNSLLLGDAQHAPLEGRVDLIYIDPPFAVQSDFKINVEIENGLADEKLPTLIEELAYTDTWKDGLDSYLSMMRDRLELLKRLLAPTGSIYVHCDWHAGHYIKVLMDEIFGYENFQNEIVWQRTASHNDPGRYGNVHDVLFFYSKSEKHIWYGSLEAHSEDYLDNFFIYAESKTGEVKKLKKGEDAPSGWRRFRLGNFASPHPRPNLTYEYKGYKPPANGWRVSQTKMRELDERGRLWFPESKEGRIQTKSYLDEVSDGKPTPDVWLNMMALQAQATEKVDYPTQKPLALLQRVIAASSSPGDLVLDCFAGSGTTVVAAETMTDAEGKAAPRRWIAIDCGKFAVNITRKRLIEANARPFAVENVGFYARSEPWRDKWAGNPSAKMYRDAMCEVYGGASVEGFTYLHGRKGSRWVHVGPLNVPVADGQVEAILKEAAGTDTRAVDILSADIPIDWNKSQAEQRYGVSLQAKIIPQAAIDAVKDRLKRRRAKDPTLETAPDIHFFSPPDVEIRADVSHGGAVVKLLRLTIDLDDCLSTQDAAKRAEIKKRITDWKVLVDYWAVDWDYDGQTFTNRWQSFRTRKKREIAPQAAHDYLPDDRGEKRIAVKVTDIFGNDALKVIRVTV